ARPAERGGGPGPAQGPGGAGAEPDHRPGLRGADQGEQYRLRGGARRARPVAVDAALAGAARHLAGGCPVSQHAPLPAVAPGAGGLRGVGRVLGIVPDPLRAAGRSGGHHAGCARRGRAGRPGASGADA
ncbi:hypothetical protein BAGA_14730, partial [Bacillus gaemokensis]